jgi:hypothetical protein
MIGASVGRTRGWRGLFSLLLLAPVLLAACSDNEGRKGPGFGASITGVSTNGQFQLIITLNPNTINKGGTVGITVTMQTLRGIPITGRKVSLSTSGGTLASVFGTTDQAGKFVSSLRVPQDYSGSNPITITASADGQSVQAAIIINDLGTLAIVPSSATLAPGDQQIFDCVGGVPPYTWEPSGGTINTAHQPQVIFTAGSAPGTFTLKCSDSAGNAAAATITISLTGTELTITPTAASLRPGQSQTFQASGGRPPYTWSFSPAAGTLSTTTGPSTILTAGFADGDFTLTLRDSTGATKTATVTIRVETLTLSPATTTITRQATGPAPGSCGTVKFTVNYTISGGVPPYTATSGFFGSIPLSSSTTFVYNFSQAMNGGDTVSDVITVTDSRSISTTASVTVTCTASS